jgi:hypothetical protein
LKEPPMLRRNCVVLWCDAHALSNPDWFANKTFPSPRPMTMLHWWRETQVWSLFGRHSRPLCLQNAMPAMLCLPVGAVPKKWLCLPCWIQILVTARLMSAVYRQRMQWPIFPCLAWGSKSYGAVHHPSNRHIVVGHDRPHIIVHPAFSHKKPNGRFQQWSLAANCLKSCHGQWCRSPICWKASVVEPLWHLCLNC